MGLDWRGLIKEAGVFTKSNGNDINDNVLVLLPHILESQNLLRCI